MSVEEAIRKTAYEVLEEGFFLFLDEPLGPVGDENVTFTMDMDGAEVGIRVSRDVAVAMASHMLARPPEEITAEEVSAAVAEALNVYAGPFITRVRGVGPEIDYGIPVSGGAPHGEQVAFGVDGGGVELWYAA